MASERQKMTDEDWQSLRFELGQLFTPSTPIGVGELFDGRKKQIGCLIDAVSERGRHAIIYGEPGVGKTSVAQVLQYFVPRKTSTVKYIRKAAFSTDTFSSVWMSVFREIKFKADHGEGEREYNVSDIYNGGVQPSDVIRELSYFSENDIPIIVVDEFNVVRDAVASSQMAETIKAVSDASLNATIVIVGISDTVEGLISGHGSIARCTEEVLMPRMKSNEMQSLLETRLSRVNMTVVGDAKWKIINLSKGLPAFAHSLGKAAAQSAVRNRRLKIVESDVDNAVNDLLESSQNTLKLDYETAVRSNQSKARFRQILTACAMANADESGYFTPKQVQEPLAAILKKPIGLDGFNDNLKEFASEKRGNVLQRVGIKRIFQYRFRDPAMQPYVIMKGITEGFLDEKAKMALSAPEMALSAPEQKDLFSTEH